MPRHSRPLLPSPRAARSDASGALLSLLVVLTACAAPDPEPDIDADAGAALDSVYAVFSEAYAQANVQLLMDEVYAPDAYYLPPGSPILESQDQFRGQFSFLERYALGPGPGPEISFDIVDRRIAGNLATDIGIYTLRTPDAPADADPGRGKFVVVWRRNDRGEWRIHADAFSSLD